jgi:hypothetical protein
MLWSRKLLVTVAMTGSISFSGLLPSPSSAAPASVVDGNAAGYEASLPSTAGVLRTNLTVADHTCTRMSPDMTAYIALNATNGFQTYVEMEYSCSGNQPGLGVLLVNGPATNPKTKLMGAEVGDKLQIDIRYGEGTSPGHDEVSVADKTSHRQASLTAPESLEASGLNVWLKGDTTHIPVFTAMHFSDISFDGTPLGQLSGLVEQVMVNTNGEQMAKTGLISSTGKGFTLYFRRSGVGTS